MPTPKEERAGRNAVVEHLVDRALDRGGIEREDSEDDEAQVADRRIGHQAFQIGLHGRDECGVDDADDCQNCDGLRHTVRGLRKQRQAETQDAVRAQFQHDACKDHRT